LLLDYVQTQQEVNASCLSQIYVLKRHMMVVFQKTNYKNTYLFVDLGRLWVC